MVSAEHALFLEMKIFFMAYCKEIILLSYNRYNASAKHIRVFFKQILYKTFFT